MKDRDPYHLALSTLTRFAQEGRFGWGEPLVTTTLAAELGLSPTPIREALARLAGEGVIEHRPGRGYAAPSLTASDIVDLYELHRRLCLWALEGRSGGEALAETARDDDVPARPEVVFAAIADRSGNPTLVRAQRRMAMQLRPVRAAERETAPLPLEDLIGLERACRSGHLMEVRMRVEQYHDGRQSVAQAVYFAMRRSIESIEQI